MDGPCPPTEFVECLCNDPARRRCSLRFDNSDDLIPQGRIDRGAAAVVAESRIVAEDPKRSPWLDGRPEPLSRHSGHIKRSDVEYAERADEIKNAVDVI